MSDSTDKEDHIHDWTPPHMRQDTPAVRAANKASGKQDAAEESADALDEAVKESKRAAPAAKQGKRR